MYSLYGPWDIRGPRLLVASAITFNIATRSCSSGRAFPMWLSPQASVPIFFWLHQAMKMKSSQ